GQELEEGQERVDTDGDLALPVDEVLGDLSDVDLSPAEEAEEEVEEQAGPLADAPELADLEIED
ncbi:MAG TPA: hypothetical protein VIL56_01790, partial [Gaiellaceae bacterium]